MDDETQLPDGNTPGTTEVDVTVTYPDGTEDHIKVPVTVGEQADNNAYEPTTEGVTKTMVHQRQRRCNRCGNNPRLSSG